MCLWIIVIYYQLKVIKYEVSYVKKLAMFIFEHMQFKDGNTWSEHDTLYLERPTIHLLGGPIH